MMPPPDRLSKHTPRPPETFRDRPQDQLLNHHVKNYSIRVRVPPFLCAPNATELMLRNANKTPDSNYSRPQSPDMTHNFQISFSIFFVVRSWYCAMAQCSDRQYQIVGSEY